MSISKSAFKIASPTERHAPHGKIFRSALKPNLSTRKADEDSKQIFNPDSDPEQLLKKVLDESFDSRKKHLKKKETQNQLKADVADGERTTSLNPLVAATASTAGEGAIRPTQTKIVKKRKTQATKNSQPTVKQRKKKAPKTSIFDDYHY